jgi:hypothetical protein
MIEFPCPGLPETAPSGGAVRREPVNPDILVEVRFGTPSGTRIVSHSEVVTWLDDMAGRLL